MPASPRAPTFAWLDRANELRRAGKLAEARVLVTPAAMSHDPSERNRARALLARMTLAEGEYEEAAKMLAGTAEEAWQLGRTDDSISDSLAAAFVDIMRLHRLESAAGHLQRVLSRAAGDARALAKFHYYSGLLEFSRGNLWAARLALGEAIRAASPLSMHDVWNAASVTFAQVDSELGQFGPALARLRDVVTQETAAPACTLAPLYSSLAWTGMLAEQQGEPVPDVDASLSKAQQLANDCGDPYEMRVARLNLGLRAVARREVAAADQWLTELRKVSGRAGRDLSIWELHLQGQIELARGRWRSALRSFERERLLADAAGDTDAALRGDVGVANALEAMGRPDSAVATYRAATKRLLSVSAELPLGLPRDGYFGVRDAPIAQLVSGLIRVKRYREAFDVGLRAYRQTFAALGDFARARTVGGAGLEAYLVARAEIEREAGDDWKLSAEELRSVAASRARRLEQAMSAFDVAVRAASVENAPLVDDSAHSGDDVSVLVIPDRANWHLLARGSRGFVAQTRSKSDLGMRARDATWLAPLAGQLAATRRVRLLLYGAAQYLTWDFAEWPIVDPHAVVVTWGLGIDRSRYSPTRNTPPRILIVGDPTSDLPDARADALLLSERFEGAPVRLLMGDDANRVTVLRALNEADLFIYAGHGRPVDLAGTAGLVLAAGEQLTVRDLLTLTNAPRQVILASCDGASSEGEARAGGWSIAHGFVLAGSDEVVAVASGIKDTTASRLTLELVSLVRNWTDKSLSHALGELRNQTRFHDMTSSGTLSVFVP